ncbi:MAG TPA: 5-oxoprolinase subunit PxpA [Chthoniobacteraceae bacterium]|nr:5-oxoprolinase subunit PxpA [Chthoniobacteraceae bacterium]
MKLSIDLNADLGEGAPGEGELLDLVSSASIACGFHAGDPAMMSASIIAARDAGVAVGAHPSLADRENFGRRELPVTPEEVFALIAYQVGAFHGLARSLGVRPNHVKPHGALYNMAVRDAPLADAIAHAVLAIDPSITLFAPNESALAQASASVGLRVTHEVFADRNYLADGTLVHRSRPEALLHDPGAAARRVLRMLRENRVRAIDGSDVAVKAETICIHGDNPESVAFARELRAKLLDAGITIAAPRA